MKQKEKSGRAQMEMFGLAFVVILVALGMLFAVRFAMGRQPATKEQFTQKELAQNFVTTLLSTSTDCRNTDIAELLEDCASFRFIDCGANGDSCEYAAAITKQILDNTLNKWNRAYKFEAKAATKQLMFFENSPERCVDSRPGWGYIPLGAGGTLTVRLDIC